MLWFKSSRKIAFFKKITFELFVDIGNPTKTCPDGQVFDTARLRPLDYGAALNFLNKNTANAVFLENSWLRGMGLARIKAAPQLRSSTLIG